MVEPTLRWRVVLAWPGESEMGLFAELAGRRDARIVAVVDPRGGSLAAGLAEIIRVPVHPDLDAVPADAADYLVHGAGDGELNDVLAVAEERGWQTLAGRDFRPLLRRQFLERREVRRTPRDLEFLERDTEAIHRTLSRIEEALEQESLLRWLLSLATRAAGAGSGSLMLYDDRSEELYIAFAYGLSEATLHRTRLKLGEGIAGQVAQSREARLVTGNLAVGNERDRPDIATALCIPLVWEERLLGVLNLSSARDDPPLDEDDLVAVAGLSRRFGMILARFLQLQESYTGEMFRLADRHLREVTERGGGLEAILPAWASGLSVTVAAESVALSVLCEDGSLLVAEGTTHGGGGLRHEALENDAWCEVLETGAPLVVRQEDPAEGSQPVTLFYLPVGHDPVLAVLTVSFAGGKAAHSFHALTGEVVYLLERRLGDLVRGVRQEDRLTRLSELSRRLTDLGARAPEERERACEGLLVAARGLTGARRAYLVRTIVDGEASFAAGDPVDDPAWSAEAARLLEEASEEGWRVTLLSEAGEPREEESALLAVPARAGQAAPGIVLRDKRRLHALDGAVFAAFDAELAQRLAGLLPALLAEPAPARGPGTEPPVRSGESAEAGFEVADAHDLVRDAVRREMDRCDRYHTTFALLALRAQGTAGPVAAGIRARALADRVRSSDRVFTLADGTLLVLVPEDTQSVPRLQRRLTSNLREIAGDPQLPVQAAHTVYPGRHDSADMLLATTLDKLA
ncbi:MAG: GAF domain-containing protein [Candidatus Krumholzibacteriia bacterium]